MITRQSLTTLVLGTLAGAGLGVGALSFLRGPCPGSCRAGSEGGGGTGERDEGPGAALRSTHFSDGGSAAALATLGRSGPSDGRLTFRDPKREIQQTVLRDPFNPNMLHVLRTKDGTGTGTAQAVPVEFLTRVLFGDIRRFLENYRPCEAPTSEDVDGRAFLHVRWCNVHAGPGPSRDVWFDPATQFVARFVDLSSEGHLIRSVSFTAGTAGELVPPVPPPFDPSRPPYVAPPLSNKTVASFEEFVGRVDVPVYEPAELPPGFRRTEFGYDRRALGERSPALRVVWIGYDEGVMQMNLFIASPEDMGRLEAFARQAAVSKGPAGPTSSSESVAPGTCAAMPVDTPEEIFSEGAVTVRVRTDGCRIVLRRDDLAGVSVALVGSTAMPREAYVRTIRDLVLVRSSRAGASPTRPIESPTVAPATDRPR